MHEFDDADRYPARAAALLAAQMSGAIDAGELEQIRVVDCGLTDPGLPFWTAMIRGEIPHNADPVALGFLERSEPRPPSGTRQIGVVDEPKSRDGES